MMFDSKAFRLQNTTEAELNAKRRLKSLLYTLQRPGLTYKQKKLIELNIKAEEARIKNLMKVRASIENEGSPGPASHR